MEAVRESWSDDRLDDLNRRVEDGFRRVDADIRGLRSGMNDRFNRVDARLESMEDRFDKRFDSLQRTMIWLCGSLSVSIVGLIASIVITGA
jgi:hypothetical protein